jgi:glycosyltransferase involved in cell wall biosynthesis
VTFVGYVPHSDLADWYTAADLTVLPSHSEGVPNVLLESIASGTPFVATRVGGIAEIADPVLDRLVAPGDPAALADAIVDALSMPQPAERRALSTRTVADAATQMLEVLESTVRAHRQAGAIDEASAGARARNAVRAQ